MHASGGALDTFTSSENGSRSSSQASSRSAPSSVASYPESATTAKTDKSVTSVHSSTEAYEGVIDFSAVLKILVDNEEIDPNEAQSLDEAANADLRRKELQSLAIGWIKREQDRSFARMAKHYASLFFSLGRRSSRQDSLLGLFPDLLSRVVVQLLFRSMPYARECMTDAMKRRVKRRITYWYLGVESTDVHTWRDLGQVTDATPTLNVCPPAGELPRAIPLPGKLVVPPAPPSFSLGPETADGSTPATRSGACTTQATPVVAPLSVPLVAVPVAPQVATRPPSRATRNSLSGNSIDGAVAPSPPSVRRTSQGGSNARARTLSQTQQVQQVNQRRLKNALYTEAYNDMKVALEAVRRATLSEEVEAEERARLERPTQPGDAPALLNHDDGKRFAGLQRANQQHHILFHRYAERNQRTSCWHELGKRNVSRHQPHPLRHAFNLKSVSPLMRRFFMDNDVRPVCDVGTVALIDWVV